MGSKHSKPYKAPKPSKSKPSKFKPSKFKPSKSKPPKPTKSKKPRKSQISRPTTHHQPLAYPSVNPLPTRPFHPHPIKTAPSAEEALRAEAELRSRVKHFHQDVRKKQPERIKRPQTRREVVRPPPPVVKKVVVVPPKKPTTKKQVTIQAAAQPRPYQFRPLDDIGKSSSRPLTMQKVGGGKDVRGGGGRGGGKFPICPPSHMILHPTNYDPKPLNRKPVPPPLKVATGSRARYGGTRKDGNGEWWVLLLADGKWYRSRELGIQPPRF